MTQYEIVKSIFIADLHHTESNGRPVTFDNYSALPFGPVPENTYDITKPSYRGFKRYFGLDGAPWKCVPAPQVSPNALAYSDVTIPFNEGMFSKSDLRALDDAMSTVKRLGFGGVKDWTHEHPSYKKAWSSRGDKLSSQMIFGDIAPNLDDDDIADLVHASKHMA